jgi:hypothetical protein
VIRRLLTDPDLFERRVLTPFCVVAGALVVVLIHLGAL